MNHNELMRRLRGRIANRGMLALFDETRTLVAKFGIEGAEDFLNWQLYLVRNMREEKETEGDD